jgi:hypothetical protein
MEPFEWPPIEVSTLIATSTIALGTLAVSAFSLANSRRAQGFAESMKALENRRADEAAARDKLIAEREDRHIAEAAALADSTRRNALVDDVMRWAVGEFAKTEAEARPRGETVAELASITVQLETSGFEGSSLLARLLDQCDKVAPGLRGSDEAREAVAGIIVGRIRNAVIAWAIAPADVESHAKRANADFVARMLHVAESASDGTGPPIGMQRY